MPVVSFPTERVFNCATLMCRHIAFVVIRNFSNLHLNNFNDKACNCDNLRKLFLLFISHKFLLLFISHLVKKNRLGMPVIQFQSEGVVYFATVAELNTPSDGNGAYHPSLDISQIRQFKNGL